MDKSELHLCLDEFKITSDKFLPFFYIKNKQPITKPETASASTKISVLTVLNFRTVLKKARDT